MRCKVGDRGGELGMGRAGQGVWCQYLCIRYGVLRPAKRESNEARVNKTEQTSKQASYLPLGVGLGKGKYGVRSM